MNSFSDTLIRFFAIAAAVIGLAAHYAWGDVMSNRDGRFSIDFPAAAEESTQTVTTKAGTATVHIFRAQGPDRATYTALYSDYPPGSIGRSPADAIYDGAINGAVGQSGGTLRSTQKLDANGVPGREAIYQSPPQSEAVRVRYFLVGDRLYQVAYDGSSGSESGKAASAFLDSFKILR